MDIKPKNVYATSFLSCKMGSKKAEKPDTKEKIPKAKKADAGGKVKSNVMAKMPNGKPHCSCLKPSPSQRNWQLFLISYVLQNGHIQGDVFSS